MLLNSKVNGRKLGFNTPLTELPLPLSGSLVGTSGNLIDSKIRKFPSLSPGRGTLINKWQVSITTNSELNIFKCEKEFTLI